MIGIDTASTINKVSIRKKRAALEIRLEVMPFIPWHRICKYFVQAPRLEVELQDGKQVNLVQKASV